MARGARLAGFLALLAWGSSAGAESAPRPAGVVRVATGDAYVVRGGLKMPATAGLSLAEADVLGTGAPGTLGVILRDDTLLSLGSSSEVRLDRFAFEPAQGKLEVVIRIARGIAAYVSGKIAKLAPDAARIESPVATLGIRGTRLAAKVVDP